MIEWFTEDSTLPMVAGTILTIVFFGFWVMSRESIMAKLAIAIALISASIVTIESLVVTDREELSEIVMQLAPMAKNKDIAGILSHVDPNNERLMADIRSKLDKAHFDSCHIFGFKDFAQDESGASDITFVASARGSYQGYRGFTQQEIKLRFERNPQGEWKITRGEHYDPRAGIRP